MVKFRKNPWKYIFSVVENQVVISRVKKRNDEHDTVKLSMFVFAGVLNGDAFRFSSFLQGRGVKLTPEEIKKFKQDPDFATCFNAQPKKESKIKKPKQNLIYSVLQELREIKQILILILNAENITNLEIKENEPKTPPIDTLGPKSKDRIIENTNTSKIFEKIFVYKSQRIPPYEFCKVRNETLAEDEIRIKISDAPRGQWIAIIPYKSFEKFFIETEVNPNYKNKFLSRDKNTVIIIGKSSAQITIELNPSVLRAIKDLLGIKIEDNPIQTFILDKDTTYKGDPSSIRKTQTYMSKSELILFTKNHKPDLVINDFKIWIESNLNSNGVILSIPLNYLSTKSKQEQKHSIVKRVDKTILRNLALKMSQIFKGELIEFSTTMYYFHIEGDKIYYQDKMDLKHSQKIYLFDLDQNSVDKINKYFG